MSKNYAKRDFKKKPHKKTRNNHGWLWLVTGILIGSFGFSLVFLKKHVTAPPSTGTESKAAPEHQHPAPAHQPPAKTTEKNSSNEDKTSYDFYTMLPNRQVQTTDTAPPPPSEPPVKPTKPLAEAEQFLLTKTNTNLPPAPSTPPTPDKTTPATPEEPITKTSAGETARKNIATAATAQADSGEPIDLSTLKNTSPSSKAAKKQLDDGTYYSLDVGSFDSYEKADTRKAELLLAGFNHIHIETYLKKDDTWHRVLIGHYKAKSEADRIQKELDDNHFQAEIISSP